MVGRTIRNFFWDTYDNLGMVIITSSLWFIFLLPLIGLISLQTIIDLPLPIFSALAFFLILITIPPLGGVFFTTKEMADQRESTPSQFFLGLKRYFWRSLLLSLFFLFLSSLLIINIIFYSQLKEGLRLVGVFLGGICIWVLLFLLAMQIYSLPLMVQENKGVRNILKRSALLTLGNPFFTLAIFLQTVVLIGVSLISVVGVPFLMTGMVSVLQNNGTQEILSKYDGRKGRKEVKRSFREIIKPWE